MGPVAYLLDLSNCQGLKGPCIIWAIFGPFQIYLNLHYFQFVNPQNNVISEAMPALFQEYYRKLQERFVLEDFPLIK